MAAESTEHLPPATWHRVADGAELADGALKRVIVAGNPMVLIRVGECYGALDNRCPHAGGPLGQGNVQDNMVICPWHEWAYDCRTGENDYDPAVKLDRFPVKADGDDILIDPDVRT